ncbi:hypothetical protein [Deinococcus sedimenti]|uniref:Prepilin-type N-terminal cleavage/methylation domain-containing protein n=1 Tax=Deinococcus sedimenti TaxID=1867090 RepID=A0ABQ2S6L8_9DEIO|nr:hypothetical protein [Deinococcus sedimenti]GGS02815.1 hypothetical protein GCM10008960_31790 [Deinococcus sedimenti]
MNRTSGLTLVEALVGTTLLLLALTAFAAMAAQSARVVSTGQLTSFAADALNAAAQAAQRGNTQYTQAHTFTSNELRLLAQSTGRRHDLSAALTGDVVPQAGNPPRVRISIRGPGINVSQVVTVPGGSP